MTDTLPTLCIDCAAQSPDDYKPIEDGLQECAGCGRHDFDAGTRHCTAIAPTSQGQPWKIGCPECDGDHNPLITQHLRPVIVKLLSELLPPVKAGCGTDDEATFRVLDAEVRKTLDSGATAVQNL